MFESADAKKLSQAPRSDVPFPAIVGQEPLKEALLAVGANDDLDGLLIRGEKGTAKSTATRALADLLPAQRAVADCPYGCPPDDAEAQCGTCRERAELPVETRPVPFVTLPLGASRERVVGALSVSDALDGSAEFNPGLLARANRGILYVDEVNLLDDHLVDVLLDAAAGGVNRVERDGVSVTHPANFTLVGTMNPEEGDLRPQFRDRFALQVAVEGAADLDDRVTVIERALSGFDGEFDEETAGVRERLRDARERLAGVTVPESLTREVATLCHDAGVEGHRADIATARAARTLAALDGRKRVVETDVRRAAELALPHRLQSRPFEEAPDSSEVIREHFEDRDADGEADGGRREGDGEGGESGADRGANSVSDDSVETGDESNEADGDGNDGTGDGGRNEGGGDGGTPTNGSGKTETDEGRSGENGEPGGDDDDPSRPTAETAAREDGDAGGPDEIGDDHGSDGRNDGSDSRDVDNSEDGAGARRDDEEATPLVPGQSRDDAVAPGAATAPELDAPNADRPTGTGCARARPSTQGRGARVRTERAGLDGSVDVAASVRAAGVRGSDRVESRDLRRSIRAGESAALVVFVMDASASMRGPMRAAKGVAIDLLRDAYERRDEVAVVTFAGESADVVLPPTDSVDLAARHLKSLPTGDRTPLPKGLRTAGEVLDRADSDEAVVVVVTDGRANASGASPIAETRSAAAALAERDANVLVVNAGDGARTNLLSDIVEATDGERIPLSELSADRVARSD